MSYTPQQRGRDVTVIVQRARNPLVRPERTGARVKRRSVANFNPVLDTFEEDEIRKSNQVANVNDGHAYAAASASGALYPGNWAEEMECLCERPFQPQLRKRIEASAGDGFAIALGTGADEGLIIVTRAAGGGESWLADGVDADHIVHFSGLAQVADNGREAEVVSASATVLKLRLLEGGTLTPVAAGANEAAVLHAPTSTISASAGDAWSMTAQGVLSRAAGSFLEDGLRLFTGVRLSALPTTLNLIVSAIAADGRSCTLVPVSPVVLPAIASSTTLTLTAPGKRTYAAVKGHVRQFLAVEQDRVGLPNLLTRGVLPSQLTLNIPAERAPNASATYRAMAQEQLAAGETPFFTDPSPASVSRSLSNTIGFLLIDGERVGVATSVDITLDNGASEDKTVHEPNPIDIITGTLNVTGTLVGRSRGMERYRGVFTARHVVSFVEVLEGFAEEGQPRPFLVYGAPRVLLNQFENSDDAGATTAQCEMRFLESVATADYEGGSFFFHDSEL